MCPGSSKGHCALGCPKPSTATVLREGLSHSALRCVASHPALGVGLGDKDIKILKSIQWRAMKMVKSLEDKVCDVLRSGRGPWICSAPSRGC